MKTSFACSPMFKVTVCLSCLAAGVDAGLAQQSAYAQSPQYASTYYPPQQPSALERIRSTGQNVGDFIRRKFYGVSAPASYQQQPVYQRPGNYQTQSYSLDAPAQPVGGSSGTGFQRPVPGTLPKYTAPPTPVPAPTATSKTATQAEPKTKSSSPSVQASAPAPKKRYTPAKPSTVSKARTKTEPARKRTVDEPPSAPSSRVTEPVMPEPPKYEDAPPKEPTTEARLNKEIYPLPGSPEIPPTTDTSSIAPTIGGTGPDLTPKNRDAETIVSTTESNGTTTDTGTKSSGSFLVGKKTAKAGRVVSPYAPFNELDITGLPSGSLALDPTTQKVFEVP